MLNAEWLPFLDAKIPRLYTNCQENSQSKANWTGSIHFTVINVREPMVKWKPLYLLVNRLMDNILELGSVTSYQFA